MSYLQASPRWLRWLEKKMSWLAIPGISVLLVTLQGLGFLMVMSDPIWITRLALIPEAVLLGEPWRLITFLALPLSMSPIWVLFSLWFLYFVVNLIEQEWGAFKTTLYVLISIMVTIGFSFAFSYPVTNISKFESSLFLAAAALFPEMEIRLFFAIPVKIKWLAWFTLALVGIELVRTDWMDRFFILAIYSNYLVFFGPQLLGQIKNAVRRYEYKRRMR